MGIFSSGKRKAAASKAGRKSFAAGKQTSAKHAAAHADAMRRQAEFRANKRKRGL